jgi:hypothetical protein
MIYYEDAIRNPDEYRKHLAATMDLADVRGLVCNRLSRLGVHGHGSLLRDAAFADLLDIMVYTPPDGDDKMTWFEDDEDWQAACLANFPHEPQGDDPELTDAERNGPTSVGAMR